MQHNVNKEIENLLDVMMSWYDGKYVSSVERKLTSMNYTSGRGFCIGVNSGTSALLAALAGIGVREGDEIIVPSFTFSAPAFAVEQVGATCKFADINPTTWNIGVEQIEPLITNKTKAIIVVHLYGLPADMPKIMDLARAYDLKVIEDCAEAFFAKIDGQNVGTFGDMSIFSFEKSKHLTCGSGGAVITENPEYAERARKFSILGYSTLRASGSVGTKDDIQHPLFNRHYSMGYNFRLPELCAAVLNAQLDKAKELVDKRVRNAKIYDTVVREVSDKLYRKCEFQYTPKGFYHTYWTYAFLLPRSGYPIQQYEEFRSEYLNAGGHKFFAGWRCVPDEPYFRKKYGFVNIPEARFIQPRLVCLNTGFEDEEYTKKQARLLVEPIRKIQ